MFSLAQTIAKKATNTSSASKKKVKGSVDVRNLFIRCNAMSGTIIDRALGVIPNDKQLHGLWMFFVTSVLLLALSQWLVLGMTLALIIVKEVLDGKTNSMNEHFKDIIAGAIGIAGSFAVYYIGG